MRSSFAIAAIALFACFATSARAESVIDPMTGISITVVPDGTYTIQTTEPAWTFSGMVGGAVRNIRTNSGTDNAGFFQEILFDEGTKVPRHFSIRTWSGRKGVLFTQVLSAAATNPLVAFPRFSTMPHAPYNFSFGGCWFKPHFDLSGTEGPWVFFDSSANTAIVSPAKNFMIAKLDVGPNGAIESRIDTSIAMLPEGHAHATLLVVDRGINHAFDRWGRILTDLSGKSRPSNDADASLKYLGYWTDNGAAYYYNYDPAKGYEGTLLSVRDDFARMGLPIGYVQLDSWWYRKGGSGDWNPSPDQWNFGIWKYEAHPDLFPNGLASFRDRVGVPLVTHARWIDVQSPYRSTYAMSNNVAVDPQYWKDIAKYLRQSGVATYEQDWLDSRATTQFDLSDPDAFMDNMAHALAANGITMQYCMPTPRHVLQGSKYSNLTSIRMSDDHFERSEWAQVLYASRLASSIGVWPWVDVFSSHDVGNLTIATLSAGVVGASDAIGTANAKNLSRAARADGVLVKPDAPIVPTDATFISEAQSGAGPIVAYTYSDHDGGRAVYVFALRRGDAKSVAFTPSEAGLSGNLFAYDIRTRGGMLVNANGAMALDLSNDWTNVVLVPVSRCGIALVGDRDKFATRGRARIAALADRGDSIDVTLSFAAGEKRVTLTGWSSGAPQVAGDVVSVSWNSSTGMFEAVVAPGADATAHITITSATPKSRRRSA